jgi:hypothetical protein
MSFCETLLGVNHKKISRIKVYGLACQFQLRSRDYDNRKSYPVSNIYNVMQLFFVKAILLIPHSTN